MPIQLVDFFVALWEVIKNIWEWILIIVPAIADICLFLIAVYTFYLTVCPRRLKFVGYNVKNHIFAGSTFSVALENRHRRKQNYDI